VFVDQWEWRIGVRGPMGLEDRCVWTNGHRACAPIIIVRVDGIPPLCPYMCTDHACVWVCMGAYRSWQYLCVGVCVWMHACMCMVAWMYACMGVWVYGCMCLL